MRVYFTECDFTTTFWTQVWRLLVLVIVAMLVGEAASLNGSHVCNVKQKYNITKRVKYRAPMYVRTYEWCFAMPPRCSRWTTEMRDLTRLETEERTAEVAICCPGYKMKDIACVPICPNGKTGPGCADDCPKDKWGPNCVNPCTNCSNHGKCSPVTGNCICQDEWKGESCNLSTPATTTSRALNERTLTSTYFIKTTLATTSTITPSTITSDNITSPVLRNSFTTQENPTIFTSDAEMTAKTNIHFTKSKSITHPFTTEVIRQIDNTEFSPNLSTIKNNLYTYLESTTSVTPAVNSDDTTTKTTDFKPSATLTTHKAVEPTTIILKPEVITTKPSQPTTRFKPKEIWIKPAQKGESSLIDSKVRESLNLRPKTTNKDVPLDNTTPRTIIVSIIPTSIAYTTFKKIHLTTAPFQRETNDTQRPHDGTIITTKGMRKPTISNPTSTPTSLFTLKLLSTAWTRKKLVATTVNPLLVKNITNSKSISSAKESTLLPFTTTNTSTVSNSKTFSTNRLTPSSNRANITQNVSLHNTITTKFPTNTTRTYSQNHTELLQTSTATNTVVPTLSSTKKSKVAPRSTTQRFQVTSHPSVVNQSVTAHRNGASSGTSTSETTKHTSLVKEAVPKVKIESTITDKILTTLTSNVTDNSISSTNSATETVEDETFHILTEPEHITAVFGDKAAEKNSLDLISVLSIAGGVMMSVITVAVVVVMLERCKRPRYEQVRKVNDIRMKVIMESSEVPPPYMRSIFHTPLPDPPTNEKCHYQPISTLDRNLKQFMRPVVVQAISPAMLENFRGIIECHYDHLPRRSYENEVLPKPFTAPSRSGTAEPSQSQVPFVESAIEALKCEAKFDVIDNTTSEPLYAEIPCWRPPSEHAIEIVNFNGEAITEL